MKEPVVPARNTVRTVAIGASLFAMLAVPNAVRGHGDPRPDVRVLLDGVEPSVAGLRVQVFDDHLAPRLSLENTTGEVLEVLDAGGRPFVRIGVDGVAADLAAAAWYRSLTPGGVPLPSAARGPDPVPMWRPVRAQPAWGWFDPRLEKHHLVITPAPDDPRPLVLEPWAIDARLGGRPLVVRGHFLHLPRPGGHFVARITAGTSLAPDVHVTLSPGRPPTLLLENAGATPVIVLGTAAEPFLRITAEGVEANLISPTWQDLGRYRGEGELPPEPPVRPVHWARISLAPRYGWLEPRAGMPAVGPPRPPDNTRSKVKGWHVPVLVGNRAVAIQGVVEWVPEGHGK